jgi:DNA-binding transcriptional LysR family regulator
MVRKIDWDDQIGRRLKLRDLHVFFTAVQRGSMAKAAAQLGVSQPAVSEIMANLEHALGVQLLDRSQRGVEPTIYGRALLKRGTVAFDELKQGIRDIEFLADPTAGELRIGCVESIASTILPPVIQRFSQQYPDVVLHVHQLVTANLELPELRERRMDLVLARILTLPASQDDDLNLEVLFDDNLVVAAGKQNQLACRRKIDLAELVDEPWILTPPDSWTNMIMAETFRLRGLDLPKIRLMTFSVYLRVQLLAAGPFITAFPSSMLRLNAGQSLLKILPVDLPVRPWPVAVITLKNRTLSPVVQLFVDHIRAFTKTMAAGLKPDKNAVSATVSKTAAAAS